MFDHVSFDLVGPQEVAVVQDVVYVRWHGTLELEHMTSFAEYVRARTSGQPWALQIMDFADLTNIPARTRKKIAEVAKDIPYRGFVVLNASFKMEVILKLVIGAIQMLSKIDSPAVFVKSEAEAQAWVKARRSELATAAAKR